VLCKKDLSLQGDFQARWGLGSEAFTCKSIRRGHSAGGLCLSRCRLSASVLGHLGCGLQGCEGGNASGVPLLSAVFPPVSQFKSTTGELPCSGFRNDSLSLVLAAVLLGGGGFTHPIEGCVERHQILTSEMPELYIMLLSGCFFLPFTSVCGQLTRDAMQSYAG